MSATTSKNINTARVYVTASQAAKIIRASEVLFEAGGKQLINETLHTTVREGVEEVAKAVLSEAAPQILVDTASQGMKQLTLETTKTAGKAATKQVASTAAKQTATEVAKTAGKETAKAVTKEASKTAMKEVAKGIGRAAALGGAIDAVVGTAEAIYKYNKGEMDGEEAALHAVKETATGAMASGAGVAAVALVVACTGPVGWAGTLVIAGGTSVAAKLGFNSFFG